MKVVLRSSSLFLTLIGIVSNAKVAKVEAALRRGAVGRMRIGMSLEQLEATIQPAVVDGSLDRKVNIYLGANHGNSPIVTANIENGFVAQFKVFSQRFRTDIGIGVGTSLRELSRCYAIAWLEPGWAYVDSLRMRFEIREGKVASILVS